MFFLLSLCAASLGEELPVGTAVASRSPNETSIELLPAPQAFICYDATKNHSATALRRSEFHCHEHDAQAIEQLLLPTIMCCDDRKCVPSFAEQQQSFQIETIECNANKDRCNIVLLCQAAFDALIHVVVATAVAIVAVIVSSFWMHQGRRRMVIAISKAALYEQLDKTN